MFHWMYMVRNNNILDCKIHRGSSIYHTLGILNYLPDFLKFSSWLTRIIHVHKIFRSFIFTSGRPTIETQYDFYYGTSSDLFVYEGDDVELRCNASGRPTPTIEWQRPGGALLPSGLETFLVNVRTVQIYGIQAVTFWSVIFYFFDNWFMIENNRLS